MGRKKGSKNGIKLESPEYKASVKIFGKVSESKGVSISDAISKLDPGRVKGMAILTLSFGEKTKDRILQPLQTYRLFNSQGLNREVALKNASLLFQGFET